MKGGAFIEIRLDAPERLLADIAYRLSEGLAEWGAFAFVRENGVVIDASNSRGELMAPGVMNLLRRCLEEVGIGGRCIVNLEGERRIVVKVTDNETIEEWAKKAPAPGPELNICPHCGYITPYPELLREHVKVHYIF